jgi:hypothetical protein
VLVSGGAATAHIVLVEDAAPVEAAVVGAGAGGAFEKT